MTRGYGSRDLPRCWVLNRRSYGRSVRATARQPRATPGALANGVGIWATKSHWFDTSNPPNIKHPLRVSLGCWIMLNPRMGWFDRKAGDVRGLTLVTWVVCRSLSDLSGPTNDLIYEIWKNLKPWLFPLKIPTVWMSVGSPILENHHKTESYRLTDGLMVDRIIIIQLSIVSLSGKMKQRTYPGGTIDGKKYCHVIPIYWQAIFKSL